MLVVVFAGIVANLTISGLVFWGVFGRAPRAADFHFPHYLVLVPIFWAGSLASAYGNFIVTAMADSYINGRPIDTAGAVVLANRRFGRLVAWTVVGSLVGLVMRVLSDQLKVGGALAQWALGISWSLLSAFVVPILVLEDLTVRAALRRSARIFKSRWGETTTAYAGISLPITLALLGFLVAAVVVGVAASPVAGIVVGVAAALVAMVISGALGSVVNVALFQYAITGQAPDGFADYDFAGHFRHPNARDRPRPYRRDWFGWSDGEP